MSNGENGSPLADWLSRFGFTWPGRRRTVWSSEPDVRVEQVHTTRVLRRLVEVLQAVDAPSLLDLGPLSGDNVSFLGSALPGRLVVNDLYAELDAASRPAPPPGGLAPVIRRALTQADASMHGVLCWDLFDYLDDGESAVLAGEVARVLRPGGVAMAMFSTLPYQGSEYVRFVIEDLDHIRYKPQSAALGQRQVWLSRDVARVVKPLRPDETYLLAHGEREVLLRKPKATLEKP